MRPEDAALVKRLQRYILVEFSKLVLITLLSFIVLFIMIDLFEDMGNFMENRVPVLAAATFLMYKMPLIIGQVAPITVLLSVILSLGILARHGEITAIKAGGIRLMRVLMPLFVIGALISVAVILMNESVTPVALKKAESFKREWFNGVKSGAFGHSGVWVRAPEKIFNIRRMDLENNQLHGLTCYIIGRRFTVKGRIEARLVTFDDGRWTAPTATVWSFPAQGRTRKTESTELVIDGLAAPEDLANIESYQKTMSFGELRQYVKSLEADGYEAYKYKTDLYGRLSFPLVNFIMVFVGIPFALKTGRHGGIAAGVGLSVMIAFSYWIVFAITTSLGHSGVMPPLLAAAFPDVLFLAVGGLMLGYVRQ
jgi:lipopolysaccharide export system permease protein